MNRCLLASSGGSILDWIKLVLMSDQYGRNGCDLVFYIPRSCLFIWNNPCLPQSSTY